jgi:hypothetical protein
MENNIKKAAGADLNNDLINQVLQAADNKPEPEIKIVAPSEVIVDLPGGFISPTGEVIKTAEVRELTGKDEEFISKAGTVGKAFTTVLNRGTVKIGDLPAEDGLMDRLLAGDRDALMLGIFKVTFGTEVELPGWCDGCNDLKTVACDVNRDVTTKVLVDPVADRTFTVQGRSREYLVTLPTGIAQREMVTAIDKTNAELTTILLGHCILEIDGKPILSKQQAQNLPLLDRRKIAEELVKRNIGPQFEDIVLDCPDCEGKVVVPFNLGALFRI